MRLRLLSKTKVEEGGKPDQILSQMIREKQDDLYLRLEIMRQQIQDAR